MADTIQTTTIVVDAHRYGCFAARIGSDFNHRLERDLTLPSRRFVSKGLKIYLGVQDITRHPEAAKHAKWICLHPDCRGKEFSTKEELVASHPAKKELEKLEQAHIFYAVAWLPGVEAKPEKTRKDGSIEEVAIEAKLPTVMLLSDEE